MDVMRAIRALAVGRGALIASIVLAVALTWPSLNVGWIADDVFQRWILTEGNGEFVDVRPPRGDMFNFADADPARTRRMQGYGLLPWWTHPQTRARFWRPVTVLTHQLDYRAWPASPRMMHAHNIAWYALLVAAVAMLYRRMMGGTLAAALAAVMFAVDDAHALNVGWIASRNALVAATFGVMALLVHERARRPNASMRIGFALLAAALFAASLLSAEAGVATLGYLVAFALVIDRAAWRARVLSLMPYAVVLVAWRLAWRAGGYGVFAIEGLYTDPIATPVEFAGKMLIRLPTLMLGQFAYPPADVSAIMHDTGRIILAGIAVAVLAPLALTVWPIIRRRRVARFWLVGMLLSAVPLCAALSANGQLLFVGIGAFGIVGQFLAAVAHRRFWAGVARWRRLGWFSLVAATVVAHLVAAPALLAILSRWPLGPPEMWQAMTDMPQITEADALRDLIVMNHPIAANLMETLTDRAVNGQPIPRSAVVLGPSSVELRVRRLDERTLILRAEEGYFPDEISRLLYSTANPPRVGETIELPAVRVTVMQAMADGRPREVRFEFRVALEDTSLHFLEWRTGGFRNFTLPAVGREMVLPRGRFPF